MKTSIKNKPGKNEPLLQRNVQYRLAMFLQKYPPGNFNRQFRNMFLHYLINSAERTNFRIDQKLLIEGVWDLIIVLDEAADCWKEKDIDEIIVQFRGFKRLTRNKMRGYASPSSENE